MSGKPFLRKCESPTPHLFLPLAWAAWLSLPLGLRQTSPRNSEEGPLLPSRLPAPRRPGLRSRTASAWGEVRAGGSRGWEGGVCLLNCSFSSFSLLLLLPPQHPPGGGANQDLSWHRKPNQIVTFSRAMAGACTAEWTFESSPLPYRCPGTALGPPA